MRRLLHWCIVVSVVVAYGSAYYRDWLTTQSESANWYLLVVHMNAGVLIFALSMLAFFTRRNSSKTSTRMRPTCVRVVSLTMHYVLYFMLFALPLTAYIGTGFDLPLLGLTNLPGLMRFENVQAFVQEDLHMLMITFMEPFAEFHRHIGAALILPVLLACHTTAAVFHRFGARTTQ